MPAAGRAQQVLSPRPTRSGHPRACLVPLRGSRRAHTRPAPKALGPPCRRKRAMSSSGNQHTSLETDSCWDGASETLPRPLTQPPLCCTRHTPQHSRRPHPHGRPGPGDPRKLRPWPPALCRGSPQPLSSRLPTPGAEQAPPLREHRAWALGPPHPIPRDSSRACVTSATVCGQGCGLETSVSVRPPRPPLRMRGSHRRCSGESQTDAPSQAPMGSPEVPRWGPLHEGRLVPAPLPGQPSDGRPALPSGRTWALSCGPSGRNRPCWLRQTWPPPPVPEPRFLAREPGSQTQGGGVTLMGCHREGRQGRLT